MTGVSPKRLNRPAQVTSHSNKAMKTSMPPTVFVVTPDTTNTSTLKPPQVEMLPRCRQAILACKVSCLDAEVEEEGD